MQEIPIETLMKAFEEVRTEINTILTIQTSLTDRDKVLLEGKILGLIAAKMLVFQPDKIICDCGHQESPCSIMTRGYCTFEGRTYCYPCSVEQTKAIMRETGKFTLYLIWDQRHKWAHLSDWSGLFTLPIKSIKMGMNNTAKVRYDVWFMFEGEKWHGVTYGDMTQICHIKRLSRKK